MRLERAGLRRGPVWRSWRRLVAFVVVLGPGFAAVRADAGAEPEWPEATFGSKVPRGRIMERALESDSSQRYLLYVPSRGSRDASVFVTVHGISRNVQEHAERFAPYAEEHGLVLVAPFFTLERDHGYQWLGTGVSGRRSDETLDRILDEVAVTTGADVRKVFLFGFSGGAQFVHRYTLAHPGRVKCVVVGAAGWYTFPDRLHAYPYGLRASRESQGLRFDPRRFLRVPVTVLVGEADTGDVHLRRTALVDRQQGTTRLERAQNWVAAMNRAARSLGLPPPANCERVPGIEHSFTQFMDEGGLGDKVFAAFPRATAARGEP